jgi:hypothetical protein
MGWSVIDRREDPEDYRRPEELSKRATLARITKKAEDIHELLLRLNGKAMPKGGKEAFAWLEESIGFDGKLPERLQDLLEGKSGDVLSQVYVALIWAYGKMNTALGALNCDKEPGAEDRAVEFLQKAKIQMQEALTKARAS